MRRLLYRFLGLGIAVWLLGGCFWHHPHKIRSYDRSFTNEDQDPTYHSDPERADEEVRDSQ